MKLPLNTLGQLMQQVNYIKEKIQDLEAKNSRTKRFYISMSDFKTQLNKLRFKVNNLGGEYTCLRVTGRLNNQRFVAYFTHITPEDIMLLLNHQYADEHLTVETIDNLELKKLEFI